MNYRLACHIVRHKKTTAALTVRSFVQREVVPEIGIEPTTYALRMRRSTN